MYERDQLVYDLVTKIVANCKQELSDDSEEERNEMS